jgi:integrase
MNVILRKKKLVNGKLSLYLDISLPNEAVKRRKEYLKLYVVSNPKTKAERDTNKKTLLLAESIRSQKLLAIQQANYGFVPSGTAGNSNFIDYFSEQAEKRKASKGNYGSWDSVLKYLIKHSGHDLMFHEVTVSWLEDFKDYLKNRARTKSNTSLSQNSCYSYFNKVRACLNQAMKDKMILYNPATDVKGFKQAETQREYLTLDELKKLSQTECQIPQLKRAFVFSALTGLRWSDIQKLTWKEVQHSNEQGWCIRFTQQKTKGVETLPIPDQARNLLGDEQQLDERVFKGLKYSAWHNMRLAKWVMQAGITKNITFHCARHTYATLQLTLGTDIYTVSKLLGHRELKTTQVYAKIIDEKKVEAANKIPDLTL